MKDLFLYKGIEILRNWLRMTINFPIYLILTYSYNFVNLEKEKMGVKPPLYY